MAMKDSSAIKYQKAYDLRQSGLTYREIGEQIGVGVERARQICKSYERRKRVCDSNMHSPWSIDSLELPRSVRNVLVAEQILEISDLEKYGPQDLLKIPNFGPKMLDTLRGALKSKGLGTMRVALPEPKIEPKLNVNTARKYIAYLEKFGYKVQPPKEQE